MPLDIQTMGWRPQPMYPELLKAISPKRVIIYAKNRLCVLVRVPHVNVCTGIHGL
uniref:Uncharacterized protein n=1 Tax=Rhizophora mucronata TaxID=61149 RepID=A0A2P2NL17_RHIMU